VYRQISINAILRIGRRSKKTEANDRIHKGGEGTHWTVVSLKEKKTKMKKECCKGISILGY
jgi:hypothetical protein